MAAAQPGKLIAALGPANRVAVLFLATFVPALLAEDSSDPLKCLLYYGSGGCSDIKDRDLCLSSRDGDVWRVWNDKKHTGEACVWCNGDSCDEYGHLCLPFDQVKSGVGSFPEYSVASCDEATAVTELPTPKTTTGATFEVMHTPGQWGKGQQCSGLDILDSGKSRLIFFNPLRAFLYYFTYTAKDVTQCKAFCSAKSYCTGVEYHGPSKTCGLWWYPVHWTEADSGYECWKVRGGAKTPVKISDLEPTSFFYQSDVNEQTKPGDGVSVKDFDVDVVDGSNSQDTAAAQTAQDSNSGDAVAAEDVSAVDGIPGDGSVADGIAGDGSAGSTTTGVATTTATTSATTTTGTTVTTTDTTTSGTSTTTTVTTTTTTLTSVSEARKDRGIVVVEPGSRASPKQAGQADNDVEMISDGNGTNATATTFGGTVDGGFPLWLGVLLGLGGAGGVAAGAYAYVRGSGNKDEEDDEDDDDDEDTEQDTAEFVS